MSCTLAVNPVYSRLDHLDVIKIITVVYKDLDLVSCISLDLDAVETTSPGIHRLLCRLVSRKALLLGIGHFFDLAPGKSRLGSLVLQIFSRIDAELVFFV